MRRRTGSAVSWSRRVVVACASVLALLLVWLALVAPDRPDRLVPGAFLRIPVEVLVLAGLVLLLPRGPRRVLTVVTGVLLGLLTVVRLLDLGFYGVLDRPFDPLTDAGQVGSAVDFVRQSVGPAAASFAVVGGALLALALVVCLPLCLGRLARVVRRHRVRSAWTLATLAIAWTASAGLGLTIVPHVPIASADAGRLAVEHVRATAAHLREQTTFDAAVAADRFRVPAASDLIPLRGKDVLVAFVESYGRVAVEGSSSRGVQAVLEAGTRRLQARGYSARSAFLRSPTFGGGSWLAHATLQSGLWVDNQRSYDRLLSGDRTTLSSAFGRAGWRTVALLPADRQPWPEGKAFYEFDEVYDGSSLGYAGPDFGFSTMPDQYALWKLHQKELARPGRAPVMAEIDLASSHAPWAPLPGMVDWDTLGDGSIFEQVHDRAQTAEALWRRREDVPRAYLTSIEYSLTALVSFVERYGDDNLVLVLLGDHQPATIVSGFGGNHDVPITVISRDRTVVDSVSSWGWQEGMRPGAGAPVWRMDAFRDRFLGVFEQPGLVGRSTPASRPRP
ncbi:MAG TPA: CDP-alcohol phosphatidyltransferase [Intrasporangium sp.]|nr:CDP-alcohol phosphatidyltransferase [Intrasporangium sp.]